RGAAVLDLAFELDRRVPEAGIVEEQLRLERDLAEVELGIEQRTAGIDVEVGRARERARLLPATERPAGGHEGQLVIEVVPGGPRQALDESLAIAALTAIGCNQQMSRRAVYVFKV